MELSSTKDLLFNIERIFFYLLCNTLNAMNHIAYRYPFCRISEISIKKRFLRWRHAEAAWEDKCVEARAHSL